MTRADWQGTLEEWAEVIDVALTTDSDAYAQNDVLAAPQEVENVAVTEGGCVFLQSVRLLDIDDNARAIDLWFFDASASMGAENAAIGPSDSDVSDHFLGTVEIAASDYTDLANSQEATIKNIGLALKCAAGTRSIWVGAGYRDETGDTYTAAGITLKLGILQGM